MTLPDFRLEVYLGRWEFTARHHLTASDAETLTVGELLELAGDDGAFARLPLSYTPTWGTPALLVLFAVFIGGCGVFHCDPGCLGLTLSSKLHSISSGLAALCMAPCPYCLWRTTRHDERWHGYRAFHLAVQVVGLAALVCLILSILNFAYWRGLFERLFWGLYYVWVVGVAVRLLKLGRLERAAPCHEAESAAARHCALPLSATTTDAEVEQVVEAVKAVVAGPVGERS